MDSESSGGNVLVLVDAPQTGRALCDAVTAAGGRPMLLCGRDKSLLDDGSDEAVDLVVTAFDARNPTSTALLERLLGGELFPAVPQVHLVGDERLRSLGTDAATIFLDAEPEPEELTIRLRLAAEIGRLRRELARASVRDALTGSHNRRFVVMRLEQEFSRARRHRTPLSLVLFDVDASRPGPDRDAVERAQRVVRQLGRVLAGHVRKEDVFGRWGDRSYAVILTGSPHRGAAAFASKVRAAAENLGIPVSAGISAFDPKRAMDGSLELLVSAERALGEARSRGGNRVFIDEAVLRRERRLAVIADPDPELLDLAEDLLSMDDFRVVRAECETTLLETLRYRRPDVLILDLQRVAEGEPAALIERIRAMFPEAPVPIVGLSSIPGPPHERAGRIGVDRFITKPFSVSVLRSVARDLLEQHRRARPRPPSV